MNISLEEQKGKVLVLHDQDAPSAKKEGKTWIHFIRFPDGTVKKEYSPPAPPPGSGAHTYRYILVDLKNSGNLSGENIQEVPVGEEIKSFVVGGRRSLKRKSRKLRRKTRNNKKLKI